MKKQISVLLLFFFTLTFSAQGWTESQLAKANTAKNSSYLTEAEREAILYINLARLYPKQFAELEVEKYYGPSKYGDYLKESQWRTSLIIDLQNREPIHALEFDATLYQDAKCFSKEMGEAGTIGHERKKCKKNNYAECCSYGMDTGKDIALQWLIDHNVESLGHRKICMDVSYSKIGISVHVHKKWQTCAVAEIIW